MQMRRAALVLLAGVLVGCAGQAVGGAPSRRQDMITAEEIAQVQVQTADEVIRRLRPSWLTGNNPRALPAMIYLDGMRMGDATFLRQIQASDVGSMRFMSPPEAAETYGLNHSGGAILIVTKRR